MSTYPVYRTTRRGVKTTEILGGTTFVFGCVKCGRPLVGSGLGHLI